MTSLKGYASDLSDQEWALLEPLIPSAKPGGRPRSVQMRQILNGIFYLLRSGCAWRLLPHDYPAWSTVYDYFRKWRNAGVWEQIVTTLRTFAIEIVQNIDEILADHGGILDFPALFGHQRLLGNLFDVAHQPNAQATR
jgi:putative transposase